MTVSMFKNSILVIYIYIIILVQAQNDRPTAQALESGDEAFKKRGTRDAKRKTGADARAPSGIFQPERLGLHKTAESVESLVQGRTGGEDLRESKIAEASRQGETITE